MSQSEEAWSNYEDARRELEREVGSFAATGSYIYDQRSEARQALDTAVRTYAIIECKRLREELGTIRAMAYEPLPRFDQSAPTRQLLRIATRAAAALKEEA